MKSRYWAIVPAAGVGKRMGSDIPKQYLKLNDKTVIEHTLSRLAQLDMVEEIIVAISADDTYWSKLTHDYSKPVRTVEGGVERCHSVLNALNSLAGRAAGDDWVLVHDAARPCVQFSDLETLVADLKEHAVGGLLGVPVRDTMKRSDRDKNVTETVDRDNLWHALTPQMFRFEQLHQALTIALEQNFLVTDEASAIEYAGFAPVMVEGHADNIKITRPEDLQLANYYLQQQS